MKTFQYLKNIGFPIVLLLLFFLLDLFGQSIIFGYLLIMVLALWKGRTIILNIEKDFLIILAFSLSYSLFNLFGENRGIQFLIIQAVFPPIFYALGKLMVNQNLSNKSIVHLILILGFFYSFTPLLSIVYNLIQGGFAQTNRFIPSYWNGEDISATKAASYLIYNSIIPGILVANHKKISLAPKIIFIAIFLITMLASFRLGSRTIIAISFLMLFASFIYIAFNQNILENIKLIIGIMVVAVLAYLFIPFDFNSPIFSTLGHRLKNGAGESTGSAGNRTVLWAAGLKNLLAHPFGWKYHKYHHNLWLDMAKNSTIIPLIFFLINNVFCYSSIKKAFAISNNDIGLKITFFLIFFSTFLLFFTEPVIEGNFFSIVIYCLFYGILKGFLKTREDISTPLNS